MLIRAVRMRLKPGVLDEYQRRQAKAWPHLLRVLRRAGIYDYSIFVDKTTRDLFAVLKLWHDHEFESLSSHPVMQRWWDHMADLMEVGPDNRPMEWPLQQAFRLP